MTPDLRPETLGDHIDRLYRAAWAMCGSREDAEDLVQETFTRVLSKRREIGTDDPLPYLLRVMRNTFISSLRTRERRPKTAPIDEDVAPIAAPAAISSPTQILATREVFAKLSELPADYRDVVVAVDVAGLSYQEAAEALKVPVGTIMSRLYRGRGRVADALGA